MKKIFAIVFALVLVAGLTFAACVQTPTPPPYQEWNSDIDGEVTFLQLKWMASPEEVLYPNSNVGAVEFYFLQGAGDWLLESHGGGYINVVIDTTAFGGSRQWAVRNLYLTYPSLDFLLSSTPRVMFSLGLHGEAVVESLLAAVFLSHEPLEEQPEAEELSTYTAWYIPYLVGGMEGGGSATWDLPLMIGAFNGSTAPPARTEWINITFDNIVAINESVNGCAPGAAARSIFYLGLNSSASPQDTYNDLYNRMQTNIGINGTTSGNMTDGKNSYCGNHGLNVTSEIKWAKGVDPVNGSNWSDLVKEVQDAIRNGCDVEVWFDWNNTTGNETGGHAAFVTSVTDYGDGCAIIHFVDDPYQGDLRPQNVEWLMTTDSSGNLTGVHVNETGSWTELVTYGLVGGFMIECRTG